MNNDFIDKNFVDETAGIMSGILTEDNQKEHDKFLGGDLLTEGNTKEEFEEYFKNTSKPSEKNIARHLDKSEHEPLRVLVKDVSKKFPIGLDGESVIIGMSDGSLEIHMTKKGELFVSYNDFKSGGFGKKFKTVDDVKSFLVKYKPMKESLDEGKVAYSLYLGDKKKFLTGIMGTEKSTKSELIAKARKEFEIVDRDSLAYLKNPKNINVYVDKGKDLVKADIKESEEGELREEKSFSYPDLESDLQDASKKLVEKLTKDINKASKKIASKFKLPKNFEVRTTHSGNKDIESALLVFANQYLKKEADGGIPSVTLEYEGEPDSIVF